MDDGVLDRRYFTRRSITMNKRFLVRGIAAAAAPLGFPAFCGFKSGSVQVPIPKLVVSFVMVLLGATSVSVASAASISFTPAGSNIDTDPIFDIETFEGAQITFTVNLNTAGIKDAAGNPIDLTHLTYLVTYDSKELTPAQPQMFAVGDVLKTSLTFDHGCDANTGLCEIARVKDAAGDPNANPPTKPSPAASGKVFELDQISFTVGKLNNDGALDFGVTLVSAQGSDGLSYLTPDYFSMATDDAGNSGVHQQVEVQGDVCSMGHGNQFQPGAATTCPALPEPGTLSSIPLGLVALTLIRMKLRGSSRL
jgi:hypothetical protein